MTLQQPFPQSTRESRGLGAGPDFPGSSGDRERGKFRPSATPGLDTVAIVNDDGSAVGKTTDQRLDDLIALQKAMVAGLSLITGVDLLAQVQG